MAISLIPESDAIDMIGPYLAAKAICPACSYENVLVHMEGPTSPVKPVLVCAHLTAHVIEEGLSHFEFEH
jgi:hypothetical protein